MIRQNTRSHQVLAVLCRLYTSPRSLVSMAAVCLELRRTTWPGASEPHVSSVLQRLARSGLAKVTGETRNYWWQPTRAGREWLDNVTGVRPGTVTVWCSECGEPFGAVVEALTCSARCRKRRSRRLGAVLSEEDRAAIRLVMERDGHGHPMREPLDPAAVRAWVAANAVRTGEDEHG